MFGSLLQCGLKKSLRQAGSASSPTRCQLSSRTFADRRRTFVVSIGSYCRNNSSSSTCNSADIEEEQDRNILPKDKHFYAAHAEERKYFYVVDTRGRIFLEETMPRNIATCMKDVKFVNFMHKTLRPNTTGDHQDSHPYVSFCGKEKNYVSPVDKYSSFCFKDLNPNVNDGTLELVYGSDLVHPFAVENLYYHPVTGRIYHKIVQHKYLSGQLALLHPFLCQRLATSINWDSKLEKYCIEWEGTIHELDTPTSSRQHDRRHQGQQGEEY